MTVQVVMTKDPTGRELVKFAERTAARLVKDNLARSQIRNIFSEARKIEALWQTSPDKALRRLMMLKPRLAYQAERKQEVAYLRDVLIEAIDLVEQADDDKRDERFQRFMELFEAILAYHRAKGGRK